VLCVATLHERRNISAKIKRNSFWLCADGNRPIGKFAQIVAFLIVITGSRRAGNGDVATLAAVTPLALPAARVLTVEKSHFCS